MLKIKQSVWDAMIRLAKAESPIEACGYLAGIDGSSLVDSDDQCRS